MRPPECRTCRAECSRQNPCLFCRVVPLRRVRPSGACWTSFSTFLFSSFSMLSSMMSSRPRGRWAVLLSIDSDSSPRRFEIPCSSAGGVHVLSRRPRSPLGSSSVCVGTFALGLRSLPSMRLNRANRMPPKKPRTAKKNAPRLSGCSSIVAQSSVTACRPGERYRSPAPYGIAPTPLGIVPIEHLQIRILRSSAP